MYICVFLPFLILLLIFAIVSVLVICFCFCNMLSLLWQTNFPICGTLKDFWFLIKTRKRQPVIWYLILITSLLTLNPELPISPHYQCLQVNRLYCCSAYNILICTSPSPSLHPSLHSPLFPLCLLVNEMLLLRAMGKENRLAPGR